MRNICRYANDTFGWRFGHAVLLAATLSLAPWNAARAESPDESPASVTQENSPGSADLDSVAQRLKDSLSPELSANFKLFVYIDKAERGPLAQRMYVFERTDSGDLALLHDWPVSTGRARIEQDPHGHVQSTFTPRGFYELDPKRLYEDHASGQWDEAMPYAMFFNWKPFGHDTGLAIHGTPEENADQLGTPASAGCVRLSLENARVLFNTIRTEFHAPTPRLAYLDGGTDVSSEGLLLHDPEGRLEMADGYSVLVLVDDYTGESRVTSLY